MESFPPVFVSKVRFPKGHGFEVQFDVVEIPPKILLNYVKKLELDMVLGSDYKTPYSISIPKQNLIGGLPSRPFYCLQDLKQSNPDSIQAMCHVVIARRDLHPPTVVVKNLPPLLQQVYDCFESEAGDPMHDFFMKILRAHADDFTYLASFEGLASSLPRRWLLIIFEEMTLFYGTSPPPTSKAVIRHKLFDAATDELIGQICSNCSRLTKQVFHCPCRSGIVYCGKGCQVANWKEHKLTCGFKKR